MTGPGESSVERRGVLVLGMHRSGTSVAARLVSLLGPSLCRPEYLLRGHEGNVRGHWECAPLVSLNDHLLQLAASRWWCPPRKGEEVANLATDADLRATALTTLDRCHPRSPWAWKDPRTCLTLPFWRRVLPEPPVVVWVVRHPAEVAASMLVRDRIDPEFGQAVWERYLHLTARAVEGLPVWLSTYDALVIDPVGWSREVARFLSSNGVPAGLPQDTVGLRSFVEPAPRWKQRDRHASTSRLALWHLAASGDLTGLPKPDPATVALMDEAREAFELQSSEARPAGSTFRSRAGVRVLTREAPARTVARRRVSVLLLPDGGPATRDDALRVRRRLPADAEVVTVLPPGAAPAADDPSWFVAVRQERRESLARRLSLAAGRAQGDVLVVLAGPPVTPLPGWLPPLRAALREPDCAVAVPGLVPVGGGSAAYGVSVSRLLTRTEWMEPDAELRTPLPVAAGTVAAMATSRVAWDAAGGFDRAMRAVGSEDLDYCLRLWRSGWRCVAVPGSQLQMRFATAVADPLDVLADTLRLGVVHLGADQLEEQLVDLVHVEGFATALARVTASDAGQRRRVVHARSWYELDELAVAGLPSGAHRAATVFSSPPGR